MQKEYNFYFCELQDQHVVQGAAWAILPLHIICMMQNSLDLKKGLASFTSMGHCLTAVIYQNVAYSNGSETQSNLLCAQLCSYRTSTMQTRIHLLPNLTCLHKSKSHPSLKNKQVSKHTTIPALIFLYNKTIISR